MKFLCHAWTFKSTCFFYKKDKTALYKVFEADNIQDAFESALDWIRKYYRKNTKSGYTFFAELKATEPDVGMVMHMCFTNIPILLAPDSEQLLLKGAVLENPPIKKSNKEEISRHIQELLKPIKCFVSVARGIYYVLRFLSKEENKSVGQIIKEALGLYVQERKEKFGEELTKFVKELIEKSTKEGD